MTIFDQTETQFGHYRGKLVKYDNKLIVIGGGYDWLYSTALVEELNVKQTKWENHTMGPVNDLNELEGFTAFTAFSKMKDKNNFRGIS